MNETLKTILKKSIDRATQTGDFRIDNLSVQEYWWITLTNFNTLHFGECFLFNNFVEH